MIQIIKRLLANIVDILIFLGILVLSFIFVLPVLSSIFTNEYISSAIIIIGVIGATYLVQYPFMIVGQTVGKGLFSLQIVSTDETRPVITVGIIMQREIFAKAMSGYLICIPVLFGKTGGHEIATLTKVVNKEGLPW